MELTKTHQYSDIIRAIEDLTKYKIPTNIFIIRDIPFNNKNIISIEGRSDISHGYNSELRDAVLETLNSSEFKSEIIEFTVDILKKKAVKIRPLAVEEATSAIEQIPPLP